MQDNNTLYTLVYNVDGNINSVPLVNDVVIGSQSPADVVINSPYISRRHFQISASTDGIFITDLGGRNGVEVDGRKIPVNIPERIFSGQAIKVANVQFEVRGGTEQYTPGTSPIERARPVQRAGTIAMTVVPAAIRAGQRAEITATYTGAEADDIHFRAEADGSALNVQLYPPNYRMNPNDSRSLSVKVQANTLSLFGRTYPVRITGISANGTYGLVEMSVQTRPRYELLAIPLLVLLCGITFATAAVINNLLSQPTEQVEQVTEEVTEAADEAATDEPTDEPTAEPTAEPTDEPTAEPTDEPTDRPTQRPTEPGLPECRSICTENNYTVARGDTPFGLAQSVLRSPSDVFSNPQCTLYAGDTICLPRSFINGTYRVDPTEISNSCYHTQAIQNAMDPFLVNLDALNNGGSLALSFVDRGVTTGTIVLNRVSGTPNTYAVSNANFAGVTYSLGLAFSSQTAYSGNETFHGSCTILYSWVGTRIG